MQRNSTTHVIQRFNERFRPKYNIDFTENDYIELCKMCKDDSIGSNIIFKKASNGRAKHFRKFVMYKGIPMCVVYTTRKKKVKTIWPAG